MVGYRDKDMDRDRLSDQGDKAGRDDRLSLHIRTFINEGDYIIIDEDGTKHVCGEDKIFTRYEPVSLDEIL